MAGQTISDRILAARHSIAGQGLAKSVCKATTEEVLGPKKKHLEYLLHCTNEPNVSIPQLANLLIERSQNTSWVVVFKSLVTTHHLMCYGNERFTQYLASSNCSFQLSNYTDKSGTPQGYDMSPFIRRYSAYLNEKAFSYRGVAFDFCKVKRGKEDGTLRTMSTDKLLKSLPILQSQLDNLLAFDASANDLTNSVINTAFMYLFRDLIRLFACYNDGIINLLEKYFDMNKKQCKDALECYKKFLVRMDRVAEFLKVAETVGLDKSEIPDLKKAPGSLLEALEAHLAALEGKKPGKEGTSTPAPNPSSRSTVSTAIGTFDSTGSSFGQAATISNSTNFLSASDSIDENVKRQVLAEEEAAIEKFKKSTNPFLSSPSSSAPNSSSSAPTGLSSSAILDLFSMEESEPAAPSHPNTQATASTKNFDDLLGISGNPFSAPHQQAPPIPPMPTSNTMGWNTMGSQNHFMSSQQPVMAPMMQTNGYGMQHSSVSSHFVTENSFSSVFGARNGKAANGFDAFGDVMQPQAQQPGFASGPKAATQQKVITGDLDSSLASLAQNLNINKTGQSRPTQGGSTGARPQMQQMGGMMGSMQQSGWSSQQPGMYRPPMGMAPGASAPMVRPGMGSMMQPMVGSVAPTMGSTVPMTGMQQSTPFAMAGSLSQSMDPFGAL